jgi:hypothetical protein
MGRRSRQKLLDVYLYMYVYRYLCIESGEKYYKGVE